MEICWEGKQMCQYPTHIYLFFSVKFPWRMFIFVHTPSRFVWLLGHTWYVAWCFQTMCAPALKSRSGGTVQGPNEKQAVATADCVCPLFWLFNIQSWSRFWLVVGFQWVSNAIFVIFNHSSMGGWFPMVRISLRVFFCPWTSLVSYSPVDHGWTLWRSYGGAVAISWSKRRSCKLQRISSCLNEDSHNCGFFMDASYELSPATGHTCCVIERIPFFLWIGACFIAMIDSRWITASLKENVESIPWIDEFRES